jgi:hypothetical protein
MGYTPGSAGVALASPDLAAYRGPDDPGDVLDTTGLALLTWYPLVHATAAASSGTRR